MPPRFLPVSVSYKNHKRFKKDQSEWIIVYNTHPPIISQELWDRVREREKSVAQGRQIVFCYNKYGADKKLHKKPACNALSDDLAQSAVLFDCLQRKVEKFRALSA